MAGVGQPLTHHPRYDYLLFWHPRTARTQFQLMNFAKSLNDGLLEHKYSGNIEILTLLANLRYNGYVSM